MIRRFYLSLLMISAAAFYCFATAPNVFQCEGSRMPYPVVDSDWSFYPDSLHPVMINHVGRHGARFPTSPTKFASLIKALNEAAAAKSITKEGRNLLALASQAMAHIDGKWGELDSLGMSEQAGIAHRMYQNYTEVFKSGKKVSAIASYVPRCLMSMYSFCHELALADNSLSISATSGEQYSPLMRPFTIDPEFIHYYDSKPYKTIYNDFRRHTIPTATIRRALGNKYPLTQKQAESLTGEIYYLLSSCRAMGMNIDPLQYVTIDEYRQMWETDNLRQYYTRNANNLSDIPSRIAIPLVLDIVTTTQKYIDNPQGEINVRLRFGHAETIMPLVSLLRLKGCYLITSDYSTIATHWKSYEVVPMASNLQLVLFKSDTGHYYIRAELNEKPIPLIEGSDIIYVPWIEARDYLLQCTLN